MGVSIDPILVNPGPLKHSSESCRLQRGVEAASREDYSIDGDQSSKGDSILAARVGADPSLAGRVAEKEIHPTLYCTRRGKQVKSRT